MEQQKFIRRNNAMFDAQRRQEKKRTRRTAFYVLLFLSVTLIFFAVCVTVFLNVETVNVNGIETYSYEQIMEHIPINIGDNIFIFNAEEIEDNIKQKLPYIGSVKIERDLPTTVDINIVEEEAYYAAELAGDTYLLSSDLKVLERVKDSKASEFDIAKLSLVSVKNCIVGNYLGFVDERTSDALAELYSSFADNYIEDKINAVDVRSRFDIYITYDNRFEIYLGDTDNIEIKISFLVRIIDELEPNAKGKINLSNYREAAVALS